MRCRSAAFLLFVALCRLGIAQEASPTPGSVSRDKKWEFVGGDSPTLVKAGTDETVLEFSDQCDIGCGNASILWAPDSKRFAFTRGEGKERLTSVYQLQKDEWTQVKDFGEDDEISNRAVNSVNAQARKKGLPKKTFLHQQWWRVEANGWTDANTLVIRTSLAMRVHTGEGEDVGEGYGSTQLVTLRFDDADKWKIVSAREMTGKPAESASASTPLSDKVLFQSPHGSYRIQASMEGTSLWIVGTSDPKQRKQLPGADPDDREPDEFSASPDDLWLLDNRSHELYRDAGKFAFAPVNRKQWFWKSAVDYASKEFHFDRKEVEIDWASWSFDSARMLIDFMQDTQHRFAYFNTRTKTFEQTPYLKMINARINTAKSYEAFPIASFAGDRTARFVVFAEPLDPVPSAETLKARFDALDQELKTLREKSLAEFATRTEKSNVDFIRDQNEKWYKTRDQAVEMYLPFAQQAEQEIRKLQFLCDITQKEVNGLKEK